jgi:hypothetical protein
MVNDMSIDKKILEELHRYNSINKYIMEQGAELPPPPAGDVPIPPAGDVTAPAPEVTSTTPPPAPTTEPTPVDVKNDPDVEKVGEEKDTTEEIEVTDLVKSQKNIEDKQTEYFEGLFKHLDDLEGKLSNMDLIMNKLNDLESKIEKIRPKTPQEKLELRSLDSGPFNQKLSQYFEDKEEDFEKTGKNEYILTQDEVEDYNPTDIKRSFRNFEDVNNQLSNIK